MHRIGVFVCWCGSNIAATVDVERVVAEAKVQPGVVFAQDYQYMCSEAGQNIIKDAIRTHALTGVVVCSCSPRMHEATFRKAASLAGLRVALIGAAPCTPEVTAALREKGIKVYLGYGLTETSSGIAITQDLDEPEALYPCPGADFRIEEDGEVTIATPCMMQGYIGAEPMFEGDRFFTGDLGWFDDKGRLHLKGRKKDVLLMADGTKIFCPEYEENLEHLTGLPDLGVTMKNGRAVLVAGSLSNDPATEADMRAKLLKTVGEYNRSLQRSQQIYDVIVRAEPLPRTATGKIKRYELQEQIGK